METPQQLFTPNLTGCGNVPTPIATSSIQQPISPNGLTHLHFRNITEFYSPHNLATFKTGGLAGFFFHIMEDGCYRVAYRVKRYREDKKHPIVFSFHIHEMGVVPHQESTDGEYILLTVDMGQIWAVSGYWAIYLRMIDPHPDNVFSFHEASLERVSNGTV